MTTKTDAGPNKHTHGLTATDAQLAVVTKTVSDLADTLTAVSSLAATSVKEETAARKATDVELLGTINDATQALSTVAGNVTLLDARVAKLERPVTPPPVDPPKPPDIPGPLPTGTTPPKAVRDIVAVGGDATAAVAAWIGSVPDKTVLDWDNLTIRLKQLLLEGRSLRFHGAGKLIFTAFMTGSAAGSIHMRNQCRDMVFDHRGPDGKPQLVMVGAAPASDYGRAHNSQEATENNHLFWLQGVQGCEIAGVIGYGAGGDTFYSGGWTAKAGQWTHDLHVHHNVFSAMGRMFGALADGGTNVLVEDNDFGVVIPGTPIDSLAKAGPGWNGVIIEPNDAPVADGSAYGYGNVIVRNNRFGRGYHPGGVSGGATSASARGGKTSTWAAPIRWENNVSDPAFPWQFVNSYGQVVTQAGNR